MVNQCGGRRPRVGGRQAPRLLHAYGLHVHDRTHLAPTHPRPGVAQIAGASATADPLGRGPDFPVHGGHQAAHLRQSLADLVIVSQAPASLSSIKCKTMPQAVALAIS